MALRRPVVAVAKLVVRPIQRRVGNFVRRSGGLERRFVILQPDRECRALRVHEFLYHGDQPFGRSGHADAADASTSTKADTARERPTNLRQPVVGEVKVPRPRHRYAFESLAVL